jgi:hypothetical protein
VNHHICGFPAQGCSGSKGAQKHVRLAGIYPAVAGPVAQRGPDDQIVLAVVIQITGPDRPSEHVAGFGTADPDLDVSRIAQVRHSSRVKRAKKHEQLAGGRRDSRKFQSTGGADDEVSNAVAVQVT